MAMARINASWSNWPGAPGLSTFYTLNPPAQGNVDAIRTFFNALVNFLPTGLTVNVPSTGDVISEVTGAITGNWSVGTTPATVTGVGTGAYAGNAGGIVHWLTSTIVAGRRVRGRTFIVPLVGSSFDTNGSLSSTALSAIGSAASTYVTAQAGVALVWSRPGPGRGGSLASITSSRVPDLAISLRSRRV